MKFPRPGNNGLSLKDKKTLNLESMTAGGYTPVDSNDRIGGEDCGGLQYVRPESEDPKWRGWGRVEYEIIITDK